MSLEGKDLYSKKYNLRFYHIPKNAMTAIIHTFNMAWVNVEQISRDAKTFCVLRNPFDRAVSSYLQIQILMKRYGGQSPNYPFARREPRLSDDRVREVFMNRDEAAGVAAYFHELFPDRFFDGHHLPQVEFLQRSMHRRSIEDIDEFLDFRRLDAELSRITGRRVKMKQRNRRPSRQKGRLEKIFQSNEKAIREIYQADWVLYQQKIAAPQETL